MMSLLLVMLAISVEIECSTEMILIPEQHDIEKQWTPQMKSIMYF